MYPANPACGDGHRGDQRARDGFALLGEISLHGVVTHAEHAIVDTAAGLLAHALDLGQRKIEDREAAGWRLPHRGGGQAGRAEG
ncbi:MAG TPA: hypothetical protein VKG38_15355, partial [Solirubrobacteraceae bacterium]|nr:hypothetical protein [Solirubrobacteraceae bacterium]